MRRKRAWGAVAGVLAMVVAGAGCSDERPSPAPDDTAFSYGTEDGGSSTTEAAATSDAVTTSAPTTTAPSAPPPAPTTGGTGGAGDGAAPAAARSPRPTGPEVANRATRRDGSGLELTIVVADKVEFAANEDVTMQLSFVNRTEGALFRNGAQQVFFELVGQDAFWRTTSCQAQFGGQRPPPTAIAVEPGEDNRFVGTYPADPRSRTRGECRVPPGEYDAVGIVEWCPPNALSRPGGGGQACDPDADVEVRSDPVRIRIG